MFTTASICVEHWDTSIYFGFLTKNVFGYQKLECKEEKRLDKQGLNFVCV
jgi:hypothetical protein